MIVFFSDVHLGLGSANDSRRVESELVSCLKHLESRIERLIVVGDLFHHYIEYRHLVPKGAVRLLGLLASWSDRGMPINYVVGNHDAWHIDYFESELGIPVSLDALVEPLCGYNVHVAHGDGLSGRGGRIARRLLRHPFPVSLYRSLLPSDTGLALAKWYGRVFYGETHEPKKVLRLRREAQRILDSERADIVVMGHVHRPERTKFANGTYLNTGCWRSDRTFGILEQAGPSLAVWRNGEVEPFDKNRLAEQG